MKNNFFNVCLLITILFVVQTSVTLRNRLQFIEKVSNQFRKGQLVSEIHILSIIHVIFLFTDTTPHFTKVLDIFMELSRGDNRCTYYTLTPSSNDLSLRRISWIVDSHLLILMSDLAVVADVGLSHDST